MFSSYLFVKAKNRHYIRKFRVIIVRLYETFDSWDKMEQGGFRRPELV